MEKDKEIVLPNTELGYLWLEDTSICVVEEKEEDDRSTNEDEEQWPPQQRHHVSSLIPNWSGSTPWRWYSSLAVATIASNS